MVAGVATSGRNGGDPRATRMLDNGRFGTLADVTDAE
jgi:hypothetical protein